MITKEILDKLKTYIEWNKVYYAGRFELCIKKVAGEWTLFEYNELNGDERYLNVPVDLDDLKYLTEKYGVQWEDD